ncbi:hypothetical protein [Lichenihabitans psoromatis]|uniref:hypothetical protein n=1 Tax=Lichenihabitans psoromatis TaxID=2528642 RepID=UPI001FE193CA|nr:hypothetical protein [Lichenihabitans psoromatis]
MIDRAAFFDTVRASLFGGWLSSFQVEGMTLILDEWDRRKLTDTRHLAYALATTFHETGAKMQPVREGGGEAYLKAKPYYPWVGEGLVQVTWEVNARKFGATKPGDCMSWPVALRALFDGMGQGLFTGKKLADYFGATVNDPVDARRIVNGTDKAEVIAGYHRLFLAAIGSTSAVAMVAPVAPVPAVPVAPPQHIDKLAPAPAPTTWGDWLKSAFFKRTAQ